MRILVTGAEGFAGRHLVAELQSHEHDVITTDHPGLRGKPGVRSDHYCDFSDASSVTRLVEAVAPDACIHLAGIAYVPVGWTNPGLMFTVNVIGTINLLEAFNKTRNKAALLVVSSSEVYGTKRAGTALKENENLSPENPYAVSKAAADTETLLYFQKYAMPVMTARPSNHIGPGQNNEFVVPSFARQLLEIKTGKTTENKMKVGNLESVRDFTDVRDVVRAYRLIIEKGAPGNAYNIACGQPVTISHILNELCAIIGISPEIKVDPAKYRPASPQQQLDTTAICNDTGWRPEITLRRSLEDVVEALSQDNNTGTQ